MYQIHLKRQRADLELFSREESLDLPPDIDYSDIHGLSSEVKDRLSKVKPTNIVGISRISRSPLLILFKTRVRRSVWKG